MAQAVLELAQQLRRDGVECVIDQFINGRPDEGWPLWMETQLEQSDFVLMVCTKTYSDRWAGRVEGKGKGAAWECVLSRQMAYESPARSRKLVPLLFGDEREESIPALLRSLGYFRISSQYELLLRYLTAQPKILPEAIGKLRMLPPKEA